MPQCESPPAMSGKTPMVAGQEILRSGKNDERAIMLGLLNAVERDSAVTQRGLSQELGIALGLANAYLRRCVKKGLIKMRQVPLNRYAYYLTPQGFAEKSRLTAEYLVVSLNFFRVARRQCTGLLARAAAQMLLRGICAGAGELAEIAVLSAVEAGVEMICVVDAAAVGGRCAGLPVVRDLAAARELAGAGGIGFVMLTDMRAPQPHFEELLQAVPAALGLPPARVIAPALLGLSAPGARREGTEATEAPP